MPPKPPGPSVCGDHTCSSDETCVSCPDDCGPCEACAAAPSCTSAVGVPANPAHRDDLDKGIDHPMPDMAGTDMMSMPPPPPFSGNCASPQLRVRLSKITVNKYGGTLYCIVTASDGVREEVVLTQRTKDLKDGESSYFDPGLATFWGGKDLQTTQNNLTLTVDCYKVGSDAWGKALGALSMAAGQQNTGPYGWAFGIASAGAAAAAAAADATSGDEHHLNQQETIDRSTLLDLTNGRTWELRDSGGCGLLCNWDWVVTVETWGCAATTPGNPS
jgi:hypothetical protein